MNDLEKRLADELGAVATDLDGPHVDTSGLRAAGRRETVRRRALTGLLAASAAVVLAAGLAGLAHVLPNDGSHDPGPAPAPTRGSDDVDLGRPLELPWWSSDDAGSDAGLLRVDGDQVEVDDVTAVVHAGEVTLVEQGAGSWLVLDRGELRPLAEGPATARPVVGADGAIAYVVADEAGGYSVVRETGGESVVQAVTASERPEAVGLLGDRVLLTIGDKLWTWKRGTSSLRQVTGVPSLADAADAVEPRPGGLSVRSGDTVVAGTLDGPRFRALWTTASDGAGVWSDDGEHYAEAGEGEVRFATKAGTTVATLEQDLLRVVGWESDTEAVVAQWIEQDGAVTGLWRCSSVQLRCEEIAGPNGKALLPGLPGA